MFVCPALLLLHSAYFVGTTSTEETQLVGCCNFQGAFFRIDVAKGKIIWRTGMIPPNGGNAGAYAGAAIWGSSPSIDPVRNLVYIATGNLYSTPPSITACQLGQQNLSVPDTPDPCILPDDHSESVLALDLDTGSIHWAQHLGSYDTWVLACVFNGNPNCPPIPGPDADFAEAPMLIPSVQFKNSSTGRQWRQDVLVVAQKSGFVYGLNPQDGSRLWTQVMYGSSSSLQMCSWVVNFMMKIRIRVQIVGGFFFSSSHAAAAGSGTRGIKRRSDVGIGNRRASGVHQHRQQRKPGVQASSVETKHDGRRLGGTGRRKRRDLVVDADAGLIRTCRPGDSSKRSFVHYVA